MREKLRKYENRRSTFFGIVSRFGSRPTGEETLLLVDIRDFKGNFICDHCWINATGKLLKLMYGMRIAFSAVVRQYYTTEKGELNLGLTAIQNVKKIGIVERLPITI